MRTVVKINEENGRKMRYAINDEDDAEDAESIGINVGVPDLDEIDWESAVTELSNALFDMGLFTMDDIIAKDGALVNAVLSVFKRKVVKLYRSK